MGKTTSGVICPQVWKKVTSEKVTSGVVCPQVWRNVINMKYLIPIMLSLFVLAACSSGGGEMNAVTGQNIAGDSSTGISATDASTVDAPMDGSGTTGANVVE